GAAAKWMVPTDGSLGTNWTDLSFNDAGWSNGVTGVGFATGGGGAGTAGLYAYWPIREGSGTTTSNLVAGGANGTLSGATWVNDPVRGTVLSFNGTSAYVSAGTIPRMAQVASNFTWSFWSKLNTGNGVNVVVL